MRNGPVLGSKYLASAMGLLRYRHDLAENSMNSIGMIYKQGIVTESKPGFCRVRFEDSDSLVTAWTPVVYPKTQNDKIVWALDVGEQVACLMDSHMENGCIIGAIYSEIDTPPVSNNEKFRMQFKDGGSFEYDRSSGAMNVVCQGDVTLDAKGNLLIKAKSITLDASQTTVTGDLKVGKGITSTDDVSANGVRLTTHKHAGVYAGGAQSGPPVP